MKKSLSNLLKIGLAGLTIAGIWTAMLVLSDDAQVEEADADIVNVVMGGETNTEKFVSSLDNLGMPEPRPYDWNGNKVFFSTTLTKESPEQVLVRFQREFVRAGINERPYDSAASTVDSSIDPNLWKSMNKDRAEVASEKFAERWERDSAFFGGGIVPITVAEEYVAMAGTVSKGQAEDGFDFIKELHEDKGKPLTEHVGALRFIEATDVGHGSRISAVWSDEDIEFSKFTATEKASDVSMSSRIPSCMGCKRLMRFAGESQEEESYVMNIYEGTLPVAHTVEFYEKAMFNRGWRLAPSTKMLRNLAADGIVPEMDAEVLSFEKNGEFATIMVQPKHGKTSVQIMESP